MVRDRRARKIHATASLGEAPVYTVYRVCSIFAVALLVPCIKVLEQIEPLVARERFKYFCKIQICIHHSSIVIELSNFVNKIYQILFPFLLPFQAAHEVFCLSTHPVRFYDLLQRLVVCKIVQRTALQILRGLSREFDIAY